MAKGRAARVPGGAAASLPSDPDRIIDAALSLIARDGWRRLSLAAVAADAEMPILRLYRIFPSKPAILCGFSRRIDEAVLAAPRDRASPSRPAAGPPDPGFPTFMRRLAALQSHPG